MQLVKPSEISGKIMSLIDEANKFMIIVSPYYKILHWEKLINKIEKARDRKVDFTFFVRLPENDYENKNIDEINKLGFKPVQIDRLHAKVYFNEREAILTSMNLNESSDNRSLDIGILTETEEEYKSIISFYEIHLKPHSHPAELLNNLNSPKSACNPFYDVNTFLGKLDDLLSTVFRRPQINFNGRSIIINAKNLYGLYIDENNLDRNQHLFRISCVLSGIEFDFLMENPGLFQKGKMQIDFEEGSGNCYSQIWGTIEHINSPSFEHIYQIDGEPLLYNIIGFIKGVEQMKELAYSQNQEKKQLEESQRKLAWQKSKETK